MAESDQIKEWEALFNTSVDLQQQLIDFLRPTAQLPPGVTYADFIKYGECLQPLVPYDQIPPEDRWLYVPEPDPGK